MAQHQEVSSQQAKAQKVQTVIATEPPVNEITRELEIHECMPGIWMSEWKRSNRESEMTPTRVSVPKGGDRERSPTFADRQRLLKWGSGPLHPDTSVSSYAS